MLVWAGRRVGRRIRIDVLGTPRGRVSAVAVLAVLALGWPSLARLLAAPGPGGPPEAVIGELLVAHLGLTVAAAGCATAFLVVAFIRWEQDDPLLSHPALIPRMLRHRLAFRVLLAAAVYCAVFFELFFASAVRVLAGPAGLVVHIVAATAYLYLIALAAAAGARPWLLGPARRERAVWLRVGGVALFVLGFLGIVLFLDPLADRWSRAVERLGSAAGRTGYLLQAPLALALAVGRGEIAAAAGWAAALAFGLWLGIRLVRRWSEGAIADVLEHRSSEAPSYPPLFGPRAGSDVRGLVRLFLLKDHVAPIRGRVPQHVGAQAVLVAGGAAVLLAARLAVARGAPPALAETLAVTAVAAVPLVQSILWALPALGGEGPAIGLLVQALPPARLFVAKLAATVAVIAAHALPVAWVLVGVAAALGAPAPGVVETSAVALGGAVAFGAVGVALGFTLPAYRGAAGAGTGASRLAQYAMVVFGGGACAWYALADLARRLGLGGDGAFLFDVLVPFAAAAAATAVLGAVALRNLAVLEP